MHSQGVDVGMRTLDGAINKIEALKFWKLTEGIKA
jgi:hypothetical protein